MSPVSLFSHTSPLNHILKAELCNNNTILKLFVGTEYVYKMYVGIYIKRKFGMNAARCTLVESVTLTVMLQ